MNKNQNSKSRINLNKNNGCSNLSATLSQHQSELQPSNTSIENGNPTRAFTALLPQLQRAVADNGYSLPTPIHALAIPHVIKGRDLLGCAQTGTGKTAAFTLPILNYLAQNKRKNRSGQPRILVLAPTRELAVQIGDSIASYSRHLRITYTVIFGGVSQNPQVRKLRQSQDIVVATPGRLLDLIQQRHLCLDSIEVFVLDEADRMLDMGFIHDIRKVISRLPAKTSVTLLFGYHVTRYHYTCKHSCT